MMLTRHSVLVSLALPVQSFAWLPSFVGTTTTSSRLFSAGRDYAGYYVTYNSVTGEHIPLPTHLVPEALLEWGQPPPALEVIVSEDENDTTTTRTSQRHVLTVLPEVGCGIDNLEVLKSQQRVETVFCDDDLGVRVQEIWNTGKTAADSLEFVFSTTTTTMPDDDNDLDQQYRVRLQVPLENSHSQSKSESLRFFWERQFATTSSQGTRSDGGGLDGRSVAEWIGPQLRRRESQFDQTTTTTTPGDTMELPAGIHLFPKSSDALVVRHQCPSQNRCVEAFRCDDAWNVKVWAEEAVASGPSDESMIE